MSNRTLFFKLMLICLAAGAPLLASCDFLRSRTEARAYGEYQEAIASGDLMQARAALMTLVDTNEDVPEYWIELAKIELQTGSPGRAYYALSRAHEFDRSNVAVLATLTQLALLSGQLELAEEQARKLASLAPGHPTVAMVRSTASLKAGDLDKADVEADKMLAATPTDSNAKILKARILIARGQLVGAISLLEDQSKAEPLDRSALRALSALYKSRRDWRNEVRVQSKLLKLDPKDLIASEGLVEAALRSGSVSLARAVSEPMLSQSSSPHVVAATLALWARYAPGGGTLPGALKLAGAVEGERRVLFANYFNEIGKPTDAAALLDRRAQLPVTPENAHRNAVFAQSMALQGELGRAMQLFDLVLQREPDQVDALRGRSSLAMRAGSKKQAIVDAQRLVSVAPKASENRLLLAEAYQVAGNVKEVRRTLWNAFHDIPGDERIFSALRNVLLAGGDVDAERHLTEEFTDQQAVRLSKELA